MLHIKNAFATQLIPLWTQLIQQEVTWICTCASHPHIWNPTNVWFKSLSWALPYGPYRTYCNCCLDFGFCPLFLVHTQYKKWRLLTILNTFFTGYRGGESPTGTKTAELVHQHSKGGVYYWFLLFPWPNLRASLTNNLNLIVQAAGITRPLSDISPSVAEEALTQLKDRIASTERELQDWKFKVMRSLFFAQYVIFQIGFDVL